ncbi:MAG: hypothetical protein ACYC4Q_10070, partial [Victivallaceae bacterium]
NKVRPRIQEEKRSNFKFDLSGGINSIDELEYYRNYLFPTYGFCNYFDNKKYCDILLARGLKTLQLSADLFSRNPQLIPDDIDRQNEIIDLKFPESAGERKKQMEYFIINASDCIDAAKRHPLKAANYIGYTLELCRNTVLSNYDEAIFIKNMRHVSKAQLTHFMSLGME